MDGGCRKKRVGGIHVGGVHVLAPELAEGPLALSDLLQCTVFACCIDCAVRVVGVHHHGALS